jgi:hypothetical protein
MVIINIIQIHRYVIVFVCVCARARARVFTGFLHSFMS